jgi:hydrogenase nickel incorporation protein HypB
VEIKVLQGILSANDFLAGKNRERLGKQGIFTVNIMSSPGAGKTSLILQTIEGLKGKARVGVIEGDVASSVDADKVHEHGVPVVQINTDGGCHLDANMIEKALDNLPLEDIDLLLVENVGNLICPSGFALGENRRVIISSLPEGDDKPIKYPVIFTDADAVLVNKTDLLPYLDFNMDAFTGTVTGLNARVKIFPLSCKSGEGVEPWLSWLRSEMEMVKKSHDQNISS